MHPMVNEKKCKCDECRAERRDYDRMRRDAGLDAHGLDVRDCWRCGVTFSGHFKYHADAPCADCREYLKRDLGDRTVWRGRSTVKAGSVAA
jgi:hypothetical protein